MKMTLSLISRLANCRVGDRFSRWTTASGLVGDAQQSGVVLRQPQTPRLRLQRRSRRVVVALLQMRALLATWVPALRGRVSSLMLQVSRPFLLPVLFVDADRSLFRMTNSQT